jgi:hypothetical protein
MVEGPDLEQVERFSTNIADVIRRLIRSGLCYDAVLAASSWLLLVLQWRWAPHCIGAACRLLTHTVSGTVVHGSNVR